MKQEEIKRLFDYNPYTGRLIWKYRPDVSKSWNTRYAGTEVGSIISPNGSLRRSTTIHKVGYTTYHLIGGYGIMVHHFQKQSIT